MDFLALGAFSAGELIAILLAALVAGTLGGMTGFGGGLILPPVLAPIIGVKAVIPIMSVAMLLANAHRFWLYRKLIDVRLTGLALMTAIPGVLIGTFVYVRLSNEAVSIMLGLFLLIAVPLGRYCARRKMQLSPRGLAIGTGLFGIGSGTTTGMGMFLVPMLLGAGIKGQAFLATDAAISTAVNTTKAIAFSNHALLTPSMLLAGLLLGLCTIPGNYLGRWVVSHTSVKLHTTIMEGIIMLGGISLLWRPVIDLLE